jgi:hypothetical protein
LQLTLAVRPSGYLMIWDATFKSDQRDFVFGDQEEMGLGVRVATAIAEKSGGKIRNSAGAESAKATWGRTADWSDYSGVMESPAGASPHFAEKSRSDGLRAKPAVSQSRVGVLLMADPGNFRPCWFHNRDYGFMAANPFGRNAFTVGEKSAVVVKKGEPFRLRFGVLLHASPKGQDLDLKAEYEHFKLALTDAPQRRSP